MVARHLSETPIMASSAKNSMAYSAADLGTGFVGDASFASDPVVSFNLLAKAHMQTHHPKGDLLPLHQEVMNMAVTRRVVQVIIADTNENIPLGDCILHKGEEQVTDLTDQELFFELDIKSMLSAHNEKRTKIVDKKVKDRIEHLEPAKIRDLKMVVVLVTNL